jgi:hypothetical protein
LNIFLKHRKTAGYEGELPKSAFSFIARLDAYGNRALDLAARYGHFETVRYLIELYNKHQKNCSPQLAIQSIKDQQLENQGNYPIIIAALKSLEEKPENLPANSPRWTVFPDKYQGYKREYKRMQVVHDRFFLGHLLDQQSNGYSYGYRRLGNNLTSKLFNKFCTEYTNGQKTTLKVDNLPSRSRILLFCNITAKKLSFLTMKWGMNVGTIEAFLEQSHGQEYEKYIQPYNTNNGFWKIIREGEIDDSGEEKFIYHSKSDQYPTIYRYGGKDHTVINRPSRDKPGFSILSTIGQYESEGNKVNENNNIRLKVQKISEKMSSSSKLAEILRQSRTSGRAITAQQLLRAGHQGSKEIAQEDADFLNCLTLLLDLEVSSRLVRENRRILSEFDELPIGIAWGRTQSLIINKDQSYQNWECFDKNSPCHLFSGGSVDIRRNAIQAVNQDFLNSNDIDDGRGERCIVEWKQGHPYGSIIANRETLHQELLEEYGGGYESEGDAYENSDEEATL